jgi:hypothetical protein
MQSFLKIYIGMKMMFQFGEGKVGITGRNEIGFLVCGETAKETGGHVFFKRIMSKNYDRL